MAILPPQSQKWPSDRAVLFVHGIGNPEPGDYDPIVAQVKALLGANATKVAFYFLYYDQLNQWAADKLSAASNVTKLLQALKSKYDPTKLGGIAADFGCDVIWPVLLADLRVAARA